MELATAHVLTVLYAMSHRFALTPAECKLIHERGTALSPHLWTETRKTLELADRVVRVPSSSLDLSCSYMNGSVFRNEAGFVERYGVGIDEALARDRGCLSAAAASLEGDRSSPLALPLSHAWSTRAMRLMDELSRGRRGGPSNIGARARWVPMGRS